ncbi:hypothetical protein E2C01_021746 [Portunus trituberculatus]|uniref:Uncharacterized protein n=1 Tax=Portunus trituberculatus TaxID=210409 RepID=A0A5B7E5C2_PORTR|nr:hypothetical protein [Portunus trituberculatus]
MEPTCDMGSDDAHIPTVACTFCLNTLPATFPSATGWWTALQPWRECTTHTQWQPALIYQKAFRHSLQDNRHCIKYEELLLCIPPEPVPYRNSFDFHSKWQYTEEI